MLRFLVWANRKNTKIRCVLYSTPEGVEYYFKIMKLKIVFIYILTMFGIISYADEKTKTDTLKVGDRSPEFVRCTG